MNKKELVKKVAEAVSVPKKETEAIINATINEIVAQIAAGEKVQMIGFGTFLPRERKARTGRNPQTGKTLKIKASTVPAFKAGKAFKAAVNPKPAKRGKK